MSQVQTLQGDAPCIRCGYNLRGLPETAVCPECGAPVADSLRGDRLQFASPEYVAMLVRGARMVWWSVALLLLGIIAAVLLSVVGTTSSLGGLTVMRAGPLLGLGVTILSLAGWWLLSTPDPAAELDRARGSKARAVLRGALVVSACGTLAGIITRFLILPTGGGGSARAMIGFLLGIAQTIGGLVWLIHMIAANFYVQHLAARVPDPKLARRAKAVLWGAALGLIVGVTVVVGTFFIAPLGLMLCVLPIAMLVVILLYISMIDRLKASLVAILASK